MRIALAQIASGPDPDENLELVAEQVAALRRAGRGSWSSRRPRCAASGCGSGRSRSRWTGRGRRRCGTIAADAGVTVVAGMFTPSADGRVHNTLLATGGGVEASYDKIHLFDAFGFAESDTVAPGAEPVTIKVDGLTVGLATCYDLRFPGLFQLLADRGATLIVVPASWGAGPGKREQWDLLVRARALDSTSFVAACGQADPTTVGRDRPGRPRPGSAPASWPGRWGRSWRPVPARIGCRGGGRHHGRPLRGGQPPLGGLQAAAGPTSTRNRLSSR